MNLVVNSQITLLYFQDVIFLSIKEKPIEIQVQRSSLGLPGLHEMSTRFFTCSIKVIQLVLKSIAPETRIMYKACLNKTMFHALMEKKRVHHNMI